jgi:Glycosyltransferase family 87
MKQSTSGEHNFEKRLPLYRLLAVVLISLVVLASCVQQIWRRDGDPEVFVNAARLLLSGQDIYLIPTQHGSYYYYPPFFAFLNIPLIPLPIGVLFFLWGVGSVALAGWSMAAFYGGMMGQPFLSLPARTRWVICFFSTLLTARFTILHLRFGQTNFIVLALVVLGLTWLTNKQPVRSGITIGLSIVVKLTTLPFVFWFLARRSGKVLIGIMLGGLIAVMLPALVVGFRKDASYHREWIEQVALSNAPGAGNWAGSGNISLRAQVDRFFLNTNAFVYRKELYKITIVELPPTTVRLMGQLMMLGIALTIVFYAVRFRNAPELVSRWGGYALVFSLIPNFSPVAEIPHLVLLLPAYMYVVHIWYFRITTDRIFRGLVVLSFVFASLTTSSVCGVFLSRLLTAWGFICFGVLLLSAAIFRAAFCLQKNAALDSNYATRLHLSTAAGLPGGGIKFETHNKSIQNREP